MLAEIRICFDKTLKLIDCDGIKKTKWGKSKSVTLTNCDTKKPILYLDYVPEIKNTTNSTVDKYNKIILIVNLLLLLLINHQ